MSHTNCEIFQSRFTYLFGNIYYTIIFKTETTCTPTGNTCYERIIKAEDKCSIPCKGLYADVIKNMDFEQLDQLDMFRNNLARYDAFKAGFASGNTVEEEIAGNYPKSKKIIIFHVFLC